MDPGSDVSLCISTAVILDLLHFQPTCGIGVPDIEQQISPK